jgi:hypothetical protein
VLPPPVAASPEPSSLAAAAQARAVLVACDFTDARASAQRVLQFLDHMNIVVDDWEGILSLFLHLFLQFLWMYTDLAAKLEATNKAVAGERSSRQVADQAILAAQESNTALS